MNRPGAEALEPSAMIREMLGERNPYGLPLDGAWLDKVLGAYTQPHRYFHTLTHLRNIFESIRQHEWSDERCSAEMMLTALFHDVVWYPQGNDSEQRSVQVFDYVMGGLGNPLPVEVCDRIRETILSTSDQTSVHSFAARFHDYDCQVIIHGSCVDLIAYEFQIFREFQYLNVADYRRGRSAFFNRFARRYPDCQANMRFLVDYLEHRRPRIGIYAGTFNPFHIGHLSILEKAERMFDKVIVGVGINPQKKHLQRDLELSKILPFHEVVLFDSLMVDLLEQESRFSDVTLVRGLRNGFDLDYEMNQLRYMQEMYPSVQSVYIPCDKRLEHVSSSMLNGLRQFETHGKDAIYYPRKYDYYHEDIESLFGV